MLSTNAPRRLSRAVQRALVPLCLCLFLGCANIRVYQPDWQVSGNLSATNATQPMVPGLPGFGGGCFWPFVNLYSGQLFAYYRVANVPSAGWPWDLRLCYNSLRKDEPGPFGYGWDHSYNIRIAVSPDSMTITVTWGDGRVDTFTKVGSTWVADPSLLGRTITAIVGGFELRTKHGRMYHFDAGGKLTALVDRNGNTMTYAYDGLDRLVMMADPAGRSLNFSYGGANPALVTQVSGFIAQPIQFVYSGDRLTDVVDPQGFPYRYEYDALDRLIRAEDGAGRQIDFQYYPQPFGHVVYEARAAVARRRFEYDGADRMTAVRDSLGPSQESVTHYLFDPVGRCIEVTDGPLLTASTTYDPATNQIASHTDADGHTTAYTYDALGNPLTKTYPNGSQEAYTYDPAYNFPASFQRRSGGTTNYAYDANGNLLTRTDPLGGQVIYTYTSTGLVASIRDERGFLTQYDYDSYGNLVKETNPSGQIRQATYDLEGAPLTVTDRTGATWTITRNARKEAVAVAEPTGGTIQYAYTPSGRIERVDDQLGAMTQYAYDALDRLIRKTEPMGGTTDWTLDGAGWVSEVRDAAGSVLTFTRDAAGRMTRRNHPGGSFWNFAWDCCDLRSMTDALGVTTLYQYDSMHRRTSALSPGVSETYAYDAASRLITAQLAAPPDPTVGYTFAYDALDRRISMDQQPLNRFATWMRDQVGHVTRASDPLRPGFVTWGYDSNERTSAVGTTVPAFNTSIIYTAEEQVRRLIYSTGVTCDYTYDQSGRITSIVDQSPSHLARYDPIVRNLRGEPTHIDLNTPALGVQPYDLCYDPNGNILDEIVGGIPRHYNYDALDRRIFKTGPSGPENYLYSPDHWLLTAGALTQNWNSNGAVIQTNKPGENVSYVYRSDRALRQVIVNGQPYDVLVGPFGETARLRYPGGAEVWIGYDFAGDRLCRRSLHPAINVAPTEEFVYADDLADRGTSAAPVLSVRSPFTPSERRAHLVGPMGVSRVSTGVARMSAKDFTSFGEVLGSIGAPPLQGFGGMDQPIPIEILSLSLTSWGGPISGVGGIPPLDSWTPYNPVTGTILLDGSFGPDAINGIPGGGCYFGAISLPPFELEPLTCETHVGPRTNIQPPDPIIGPPIEIPPFFGPGSEPFGGIIIPPPSDTPLHPPDTIIEHPPLRFGFGDLPLCDIVPARLQSLSLGTAPPSVSEPPSVWEYNWWEKKTWY